MLSQSRGDYEDRTCPCAGVTEERCANAASGVLMCVPAGCAKGQLPAEETWRGSNVLPNSGGACECEGGKEKQRQCNVAEHHLRKLIKGAQEFLHYFCNFS